jgi:2-polyprenyl-3-methyl-5-hydroxy-6-metoxy-1,4-benzoquinol methylase
VVHRQWCCRKHEFAEPVKMSDSVKLARACPLCGSKENVPYLQKKEMRLVRCARCGMIFLKEVPAQMAGEYYNNLGTPFYLSPEKLESDYAGVRFERELRLFQKYCQEGSVLDVGCSTGGFLHQLKSRGNYRVKGTDISQPALEYARGRGLEIISDSFLEHDFGGEKFDAITFWAVMEHLLEPKRFLNKAASLLKPAGHGFILIPNMKSLAVRLAGAKYRYLFPQHVNYFTAATLREFATSENFEIIRSGSMHFNPIVIWQDMRGAGDFVPEEQRAALLKRTTAYKQRAAMKPVKWLYGFAEKLLGAANLADNLFIVLRKR